MKNNWKTVKDWWGGRRKWRKDWEKSNPLGFLSSCNFTNWNIEQHRSRIWIWITVDLTSGELVCAADVDTSSRFSKQRFTLATRWAYSFLVRLFLQVSAHAGASSLLFRLFCQRIRLAQGKTDETKIFSCQRLTLCPYLSVFGSLVRHLMGGFG